MDDKSQEPSMEDILASIRKILSEDEEADASSVPQKAPQPPVSVAPPEPSSSPEVDGDDVLELTPAMVEDDDEPLVLGAASEPASQPEPAWAAEEDKSEPEPVKVSPPKMMADDNSALLSPPAAAQSAAAFSELATIARVRAIGVGHSDVTLEGMVRDMLKPVLASWLEQHLPDMVERLVRKEIERLVSGTEKQ